MSDMQWLSHSEAFLKAAGCDPAGVLAAAQVGLMLAPEGEAAVVAVELGGNRVAWCRTYSTAWACVAIAPDDGRRSASRADFFAKKWPSDWLTPRAARAAAIGAKYAVPFEAGGMAWANKPDRRVAVAQVVDVEPLTLCLERGAPPVLASDTALVWRPVLTNAEGWLAEWLDGMHDVHNFRLGAMRAGLRIKRQASGPKPKRQPETPEHRKERYAKWAAACAEGRRKAAARRASEGGT